MKHELYFDEENDLIVLRIKGPFNLQDAMETTDKMDELGKNKRTILVMADLREAPPYLDKDVRKLMKDLSMRMKMEKFAMIVTNPAVRIIGKIVIATMGNAKGSAFFKTESEALAWLKGGNSR
ncbi:STAS/SEC14 domain-containing protein [candidate division WOR-3 bacterium]|nr:STAS/SEC14 domain-containing protein [candidate division WOR-3 bacterium]